MSLIDWSDPDEMLGLLMEYVADEAAASHGDAERARFLHHLSRELEAISEHSLQSVGEIARELRAIHDSQPREFAKDPVLTHVTACIEELHRIGASA